MTEIAEFALGLGVFFVGMQMVGEYLRQLSGPTFRSLVARFTASAWAGGILGLLFGVLMQSATGVTFVLVNMVTSGLIEAEAALAVITWTNVGLTALAFVVTLDIHPFVAWCVGISGIAASLVRKGLWKQVANVLVGVGLLLFGLETMGSTAGPLQYAQWLQTFVAHTLTSMPIAFVGGFLLAAILQSNTGATLLVITLATGGVFGLQPAAMLIYGTNLGAIVLRLLLSAGMHGTPIQLVRFEDFFCLASESADGNFVLHRALDGCAARIGGGQGSQSAHRRAACARVPLVESIAGACYLAVSPHLPGTVATNLADAKGGQCGSAEVSHAAKPGRPGDGR